MKLVSNILLFICLVYTCESIPDPTYTSIYDDINLDEILSSERLLNGYINCLLDLGPCTPDGQDLKNILPDAIANNCERCSDRQREGADKVMQFIINYRPDDWSKLEQKYDPNGRYRQQYIESRQATIEIENIYKSNEIVNNNPQNLEHLLKSESS